ncbi:MAG TPA: M13 family metallopeptidase, partial [Kofleriaceae bacterium]
MPVPAPAPKHTWSSAMSLAETGIVPGWLDKAVDPCTDFYQYACGGFLKSAVIPADRASWGSIELVVKDAEDTLHAVLDEAIKNPKGSGDPVLDKVGAYYAACMDEAAIDRAGAAPIQPLLDRIAKITDPASAIATLIALHQEDVFPLFGIGPSQDFQDATQMIASLDQAGLGLPDRKFYLENVGTMAKTRAAYVAHLGRLFVLAGQDDKTARASARTAMAFETRLARLQQDEVARREPRNTYHPIGRAGLEQAAPGFPWGDYLQALGVGGVTAITVNDPAYYTRIAKLLTTEPPATLRSYFTEALLRDAADDLSKPWVDESFAMTKVLSGAKELPPRWRRCYERVDHDLGELLGQSYIKIRFGGDAKGRAVELTKAVLGAMRVELDNLPWMDDATRAAAKVKLDKMAYLVGYPDKWKKYEFEIVRTDYAGNLKAADRWETQRQLKKIGQPVDRFDWGMSPPTVNAYYDP